MSKWKKLLITGFFLLLALSIPFTVSLLKKPQQTHSHAAGGQATLSFVPVTSSTNPKQVQVGDIVSFDMMLDPGGSSISFVRFQLVYDASKLTLSTTDPFTLNVDAFPMILEGPITSGNNLSESISIGADPTKAVTTVTKIGTVNFTATAGTNNQPTTIDFTNLTQALSTGANDKSYQSVLASTTPATIIIGGGTQQTSTTPVPSGDTTVSLDLLLHGVGAAGDNPNPNGAGSSNQLPLHPQRNLDFQLFDSGNKLILSKSTFINYDSSGGSFKGSIDLGQNFPTGSYIIKVRTDRYLRKLVPGVLKITSGQNNAIPQTPLVTGDTNNDNSLDILDYNAFLDCGYGLVNPLPIADPNSTFNSKACKSHTPADNVDINDDGAIDSTDYNLFLRELSVQNGD